MKYTYSAGPFSLNADVDTSIEVGIAEENLPINVNEEIDTAMIQALLDELYVKFTQETNNVVVNEEDVVLPPGALNAVLYSMVGQYSRWLHEKGIIKVEKTES